MASAVIGALRVTLGLNSATFNRGLTDAEKRAEKFGRQIGTSIRVLTQFAAVAAAAGTALAVALTKKSLETIDAQSKLAKRVGGTVLAIQSLEHAADLAGVSQEKLAKALEMINARLGEAIREGIGPAHEALTRLGLDAADLAKMDVDERIKTLADRMAELGYTTQQQADVLRDFGVRGGELINLFQEGTAAIVQARRDLVAWGVALSDVDAAKVEAANDAMARISKVLEGIGNQIAIRIAPLLQAMAEYLTDAAKETGGFGESIDAAISLGIQLFGGLLREVYNTRVEIDQLIGEVLDLFDAFAGAPPNLLAKIFGGTAEDYGFKPINESFGKLRENLEKPPSAEEWDQWLADIRAKAQAAAEAAVKARPSAGGSEGDILSEAQIDAAQRLSEQMASRLESLRDSLMTEREAELNSYAERMIDLGDFLDAGLVSRQEYHDLAEAAEREHTDRMKSLNDDILRHQQRNAARQRAAIFGIASDITTALGNVFGESKAVAIAQALINTAQAVTKTLAEYGGTPLGWAAAAAAAAAGATQIAAIRSTSRRGGGGVPSVNGGSAGSGGAGDVQSAPAQGGGTLYLNINGQQFGREQVRELAEQLIDFQRDGGRVVLAA